MDRNSIIGLVLIGAILILFSIYNAPSEEQLKLQKHIQDSILVVKNKQVADSISKIPSTQQFSNALPTDTSSICPACAITARIRPVAPPAPAKLSISVKRTVSSWSIRSVAGAIVIALPLVPTRRSISILWPERPRNASSATRALRRAFPRHVPFNAWAAPVMSPFETTAKGRSGNWSRSGRWRCP